MSLVLAIVSRFLYKCANYGRIMVVARQKKSLEEDDAGVAGTKVRGFKAGGMIFNELPLKGLVRDVRQSCTFQGQ